MAKARKTNTGPSGKSSIGNPSSIENLLLAAIERGDESFQTGRYLITFKEGTEKEAIKSLETQGMRVASARDFHNQAVSPEEIDDADVLMMPEIGVALVSNDSAQARSMGMESEIASDSPIESIDPEYFQFATENYDNYLSGLSKASESDVSSYLKGFLRATEVLANDLQGNVEQPPFDEEVMGQVLGNTWGLVATRVPPSARTGIGIKVAVLDTGFSIGHPDFIGRPIVSQTFSGQPVQDLNGHGTHCTGTACGPKSPAGTTPRYGIGYRASIFIGKVLTNSGSGTMASVLAGMNWAIANRCQVISMSLGGPGGPHPAYTAAGQTALNKGCLIIAAAGNTGPNGATGAPANSPTIMSVASLDSNLRPSIFSSRGKIEIAGPGRDVFSSWFMPLRYKTISGTSMATPHVAGCAALWAETSPAMRAGVLWRKLQSTARRLPFASSIVGAGLVQAP